MERLDTRSARGSGVSLVGLAAAAGLVLGGLTAWADDGAIRQRIEERLEKAGLDRRAEVSVDVLDGRAVLSGAVTTVAAQRTAEKAALKETKVVENRLEVLPEARSDAEVRRAVREEILRYPRYSIFESIELGVADGLVLLRGSVRHPWRRSEIEARVAKVHGVREIRNEIEVQSVSLFDDRLRYQLVSLIYGDSRFVQYAHRADPPIRIIVDRGHVTLTGYVASPVERAVIGHIARGVLAFGVDNRLEVDGEERTEPVKPKRVGERAGAVRLRSS